MKYSFNWSAVSGGAPYMTFTSIGIAFNSTSIDKLGKPEKIIVGFDEEHCVIGVKPFEGEQGTRPYDFASRVKNGWVRIGCKDFIKYLQALSGIDFSSAKKYVAQYDSKTNVLFVPISIMNSSEDEDE